MHAYVSSESSLIRQKSHAGMLFFCFVSLLITMSYSQTENFAVDSLQYWILISFAVVLPGLDFLRILRLLLGPAKLLLLFGLTAGCWHLLFGDIKAVMQLGLLLLVLAWVSINHARLSISHLAYMYLVLVLIGTCVSVFTNISPYGLIPGETVEEFGMWRVSFFPNVAYTGILSLAIVLILTRNRQTAGSHPLIFILALYFMLFSLVRTALIGLVVYALLRWVLERRFMSTPSRMFWVSIIAAFCINPLIAYSPVAIEYLQNLPLVSDILLQGKTDLTEDEILYQMYRPWLWLQQINLFISSPFLMGWGAFNFSDMIVVGTEPQIVSAGSEALPTRLLATYGIPGVLFLVYSVFSLKKLCREQDRWACACFPVVFLLLMHWGSVFHPADAMFVIFMLMMIRGSKGFFRDDVLLKR